MGITKALPDHRWLLRYNGVHNGKQRNLLVLGCERRGLLLAGVGSCVWHVTARGCLKARLQPLRNEPVTAHIEEVVGQTHRRVLQTSLPDRDQSLLKYITGWNYRAVVPEIRSAQRTAIHIAVRG